MDRYEAQRIFEGSNPEKIADAVLRIVYCDRDFEWVQSQCFRFANSCYENVKWIAIICLGHIARIHRKIDKGVALPLLTSLLNDDTYGSIASNALADINYFAR